MTDVYVVRRGNAFIAGWPDDQEKLKRVHEGEMIKVSFSKPRNAKFHKKYFALLQVVVDNDDRYEGVEEVLHVMKLKLGHYDNIVNTDGRIIYKPKSISFAKMDDIAFNDFYQKTVNKILKDFLKKWDEETLDKAVDIIIRF